MAIMLSRWNILRDDDEMKAIECKLSKQCCTEERDLGTGADIDFEVNFSRTSSVRKYSSDREDSKHLFSLTVYPLEFSWLLPL